MPSRGRALALETIAALLLAASPGCTKTEFDSSVHEWGAYNVCITRVSDSCHLPDAGCSTQPYLQETMPLGYAAEGNTFLIARDPLSPLQGTQAGTRFTVTHDVSADGVQQSFCDCPVDVAETIHGELVQEGRPLPTCTLVDGGEVPGCVATATTSPYDDPNWVGGTDAGIEIATRYLGVKGRIIDTVTPLSPDGGCGCKPSCSIEYDFIGSQ